VSWVWVNFAAISRALQLNCCRKPGFETWMHWNFKNTLWAKFRCGSSSLTDMWTSIHIYSQVLSKEKMFTFHIIQILFASYTHLGDSILSTIFWRIAEARPRNFSRFFSNKRGTFSLFLAISDRLFGLHGLEYIIERTSYIIPMVTCSVHIFPQMSGAEPQSLWTELSF